MGDEQEDLGHAEVFLFQAKLINIPPSFSGSRSGVVAIRRGNSYTYGVFGTVRTVAGSTPQSLGFAGEQVDLETELVFLRARCYDPTVGRFISRDSFVGLIKKSNGVNPYIYGLNKSTLETDPAGLFSWPTSYGSYAQASAKIGPIGLSLALDIDVPAAELRLSLNFIGSLRPDQVVDVVTQNTTNLSWTPNAKAVAGAHAGQADDTSLYADAFYGQGLIAGGSVSHGAGNRINLYAGAGGGFPISIGGSQRIWQTKVQAENPTFQRAIGTAMPFIPVARWTIYKLAAPKSG